MALLQLFLALQLTEGYEHEELRFEAELSGGVFLKSFFYMNIIAESCRPGGTTGCSLIMFPVSTACSQALQSIREGSALSGKISTVPGFAGISV